MKKKHVPTDTDQQLDALRAALNDAQDLFRTLFRIGGNVDKVGFGKLDNVWCLQWKNAADEWVSWQASSIEQRRLIAENIPALYEQLLRNEKEQRGAIEEATNNLNAFVQKVRSLL